jgi:hypothetical protein
LETDLNKLIVEGDLRAFVGKLPELSVEPPSVHLIMLAVRKRRARKLGVQVKDDFLVERRIIRPHLNWRERYISEVKNLALLQAKGYYHVDGQAVPPAAMGILATVCPRAVLPALTKLMKENMDLLVHRTEDASILLARQDVRFFSSLHSSQMRGNHFVTLDVDDPSIYSRVVATVTESQLAVWMITQTSRGYHIILDLRGSEDATKFHGKDGLAGKLPKLYGSLEVQSDSQEPVPGTFYCKEAPDGLVIPHYVTIVKA